VRRLGGIALALALSACEAWPPPGFDGGARPDAGLAPADGALAAARQAVGEVIVVKVTVGK